jgi:transcriptional regulator with XRE-family HTH domain
MSFFAERLKDLRTEKDLSMQALAELAHVSKSMICKIERDEVQPTLDVAAKLAHALGKTLSEMLHATQPVQVVYLPKDEQATWEDSRHVKRRNISPVFEGLKLEWIHVEFPPGASIVKTPSDYTAGEEKYILVIKGALEVKINEQIYRLKKGDSLYFDAKCTHTFTNPGKDSSEYFAVINHK